MATVGNVEVKYRIAAVCVHKMCTTYTDCCHAEKCAAGTSFSKRCYLVHQPAMDDMWIVIFSQQKMSKKKVSFY